MHLVRMWKKVMQCLLLASWCIATQVSYHDYQATLHSPYCSLSAQKVTVLLTNKFQTMTVLSIPDQIISGNLNQICLEHLEFLPNNLDLIWGIEMICADCKGTLCISALCALCSNGACSHLSMNVSCCFLLVKKNSTLYEGKLDLPLRVVG